MSSRTRTSAAIRDSSRTALKRLRERRMTVHELATALDVRDETVRRWESGETTPQERQISRLAETLRLSIGELRDLLDNHEPSDNVYALRTGSQGNREAAPMPATEHRRLFDALVLAIEGGLVVNDAAVRAAELAVGLADRIRAGEEGSR